jgi:hypothetical protein
MDDRTIEGYANGLPDWRGEMVRGLANVVRSAAPEATESIKWAQPVFSLNGPAIWIKAYGSGVNIGFWRGAELNDPHGLLRGEGDRMKHVRLREGDRLPDAALRDYVRQAVALNAQKGDPTRRQS